jgi:hypothetical protein
LVVTRALHFKYFLKKRKTKQQKNRKIKKMKVGKQMHSHPSHNVGGNSNYYEQPSCEIRSGMSVQDLKQLTAQREFRQRMEYWEKRTRSSSGSSVSSAEWVSAASVPTAPGSTSSMSSFSSSSISSSPPSTHHHYVPYGGYNSSYNKRNHHGSPSPSPHCAPERMYVTYGGQVVSFVEGVVNAPQVEFLPETL